MIVGFMTACGSKSSEQISATEAPASAAFEDVVFSGDDYSITYNTKNFEQLDVRGAVHFNYCNAEVEQAGSNVIIITKEENSTERIPGK